VPSEGDEAGASTHEREEEKEKERNTLDWILIMLIDANMPSSANEEAA